MLVVLLAVGYAGVSYLIASGVTAAEREEQHDHPSDYGLRYEDVEFPSRKGDVTLEGWYLPSICCGPTVIMVHGITSNRSGGEATELAAELVKACFNALLFDLRAHGSSGGDRLTGGIDEAQDVLGPTTTFGRAGSGSATSWCWASRWGPGPLCLRRLRSRRSGRWCSTGRTPT